MENLKKIEVLNNLVKNRDNLTEKYIAISDDLTFEKMDKLPLDKDDIFDDDLLLVNEMLNELNLSILMTDLILGENSYRFRFDVGTFWIEYNSDTKRYMMMGNIPNMKGMVYLCEHFRQRKNRFKYKLSDWIETRANMMEKKNKANALDLEKAEKLARKLGRDDIGYIKNGEELIAISVCDKKKTKKRIIIRKDCEVTAYRELENWYGDKYYLANDLKKLEEILKEN